MNHEDRGHWGDLLRRNKGEFVRLLLINTGGIGFMTEARSKETLKSEKLRMLCNEYKIDVVCLTDVNKDWREVDQQHSIWNATSRWREFRRIHVSNNTTKKTSGEFQVGGTAMIGFDDIGYRISKQGSDDRNLGRWTWHTITGKHNCNTTIVTCCIIGSGEPWQWLGMRFSY